MMHKPTRPVGRSGFTMIELLIVIAVIAVLVGLLLAGVTKALQFASRTETQHDITQMDTALKSGLKSHYRANSLPGRLVLCNRLDIYVRPGNYGFNTGTTPNLTDLAISKQTLTAMFGPKLFRTVNGASPTIVSWDGSVNPASIKFLEGHHCLVFYLGGIADVSVTPPKMLGFSADPTNPSNFAGTTQRIPPLYEFKAVRLVADTALPGFCFYKDLYGMPFAYFGQPAGAAPNSYNYNSCASLGLVPYQEPNGRFLNPNTFQIISAGKNGRFGPGGPWDPTLGAPDLDTGDNLCNFSSSDMSAPQS